MKTILFSDVENNAMHDDLNHSHLKSSKWSGTSVTGIQIYFLLGVSKKYTKLIKRNLKLITYYLSKSIIYNQ